MKKKQNDKQNDIQELVHEITKNKPNLSRVKTLTRKFNIRFSADPIEQMSLVLQRFDILGAHLFAPTGLHLEKDSEI